MNVGPSHRMSENVAAKARPESASEAINGSPSPWNVLARMARHVPERVSRENVSVVVRAGEVDGGGDMVKLRVESLRE